MKALIASFSTSLSDVVVVDGAAVVPCPQHRGVMFSIIKGIAVLQPVVCFLV